MIVPTTYDMDSTSPEDRNSLMGYCINDEKWFKFIRGINFERCPKCKLPFSNEIGFQITSQRSFSDIQMKKRRKR